MYPGSATGADRSEPPPAAVDAWTEQPGGHLAGVEKTQKLYSGNYTEEMLNKTD